MYYYLAYDLGGMYRNVWFDVQSSALSEAEQCLRFLCYYLSTCRPPVLRGSLLIPDLFG